MGNEELETRVRELEAVVNLLANYVHHLMVNQANGWKPRSDMTEKACQLEARTMWPNRADYPWWKHG